MSGVPANADIVAAYLFWETLTLETNPLDVNGVKFRGTTLDLDDAVIVRKTQFTLAGLPNSTCWSSGPGVDGEHLSRRRALIVANANGRGRQPDGKAPGQHVGSARRTPFRRRLTVTLPVRSGNQPPESAGASLVVVYRTLDPNEPLRKVVIYDGFHPQVGLTTPMQQSIQGFYKRAVNATGKTDAPHRQRPAEQQRPDPVQRHTRRLATECHPLRQLIAARVGEPDVRHRAR